MVVGLSALASVVHSILCHRHRIHTRNASRVQHHRRSCKHILRDTTVVVVLRLNTQQTQYTEGDHDSFSFFFFDSILFVFELSLCRTVTMQKNIFFHLFIVCAVQSVHTHSTHRILCTNRSFFIFSILHFVRNAFSQYVRSVACARID